MRADDAVWIVIGAVLIVLLAAGATGCQRYRHCRAGLVVLVGGPSRVDAPSHDRCLAYTVRGR